MLGGSIDVDGAKKLNRFMKLCDHFAIPIVSLCDTLDFMVGGKYEKNGLFGILVNYSEQVLICR
ncbi:MAG: acetyl-CoA carboxylase carboxyltransferase component [Congregibacter sp.]|jgi:acetyl-CoA carboxylase carboxyltransferase component